MEKISRLQVPRCTGLFSSDPLPFGRALHGFLRLAFGRQPGGKAFGAADQVLHTLQLLQWRKLWNQWRGSKVSPKAAWFHSPWYGYVWYMHG